MNYQDLLKKNSMTVLTEHGKLQIVDKGFFENKYYPNVNISIVGTIDLSKPQIYKRRENSLDRICEVNGFSYVIANTFPKDIFGYYKLSENEFLRVKNIISNRSKNDKSHCLYQSAFFLKNKKKERNPVVFLEKDYLLCDPSEFGISNKKPKIKKETLSSLRKLKKAGYKLVILLYENDAEKGSCAFRSLKKYNLIFALCLFFHGINLDGIYIKNKKHKTLEQLIECASNDCFLAAKGSIFLGTTEKWIDFTKGSNILPQFIINAKIKSSENYIKFITISDAVESFLSGDYLKKKRRYSAKQKNKTSEIIVTNQNEENTLEMNELVDKEEADYEKKEVSKSIISEKAEEICENTTSEQPQTIETLIQKAKEQSIIEKQAKEHKQTEKPRRVCLDNMEFPTKPEKPMTKIEEESVPF